MHGKQQNGKLSIINDTNLGAEQNNVAFSFDYQTENHVRLPTHDIYAIQTAFTLPYIDSYSLKIYVNSLKCAPSSLHLPRFQTFAVPQNVAGLTQVAQDFTLNQFFWHFFFVVFGSSINQQRSSDNDFQFSVCHTHTHTQSSPEMWQRIKNSLSGLQTLFESALSLCVCVSISLCMSVCV